MSPLPDAAASTDILEQLRRREPIFHRAEFGNSRVAFAALMSEDFWEIGASGQRYDRAFVLDVLESRIGQAEAPWQTRDFRCQALAPDLYLLNYVLVQGDRWSQRSTIWRREAGAWRIVFHQGTLMAAAPDAGEGLSAG